MVVIDPKITLTKLNMNSYYAKETFLACKPTFYKDKEVDYDMSDIVKNSITKDGNLIEIKMTHSNKETIKACLENVSNNIYESQKIIAEPLVEFKKNELNLTETKLKLAEEFKDALNVNQIKNLKANEQRFSTDVLYANIILNNATEVMTLLNQINKLKMELSSEQTKDAGKVLPISIKRKNFPSIKLGLLLGLFLAVFISLFYNSIKNKE